jgi:hypothetical protein
MPNVHDRHRPHLVDIRGDSGDVVLCWGETTVAAPSDHPSDLMVTVPCPFPAAPPTLVTPDTAVAARNPTVAAPSAAGIRSSAQQFVICFVVYTVD